MARVFVSEPEGYSEHALDAYRTIGEVRAERLEGQTFRDELADCEVLVVRLRKVTADDLAAAPNLKIIASPTTGLDHIDLAAAERRGVRVVSLRGERGFLDKIYATSELTVGLMLALLRHIPAAHRHVLAGGWDRQRFIGGEISGRTVGIIGCGRLGTRVAEIVHAMGASVVASDKVEGPSLPPPSFVRMLPLDALLQEADIISVHVAFTPATEGLIGRDHFARIKPGALLVNTSRGRIVDEEALLAALASGALAGAALDVLTDEDGSGRHLKENPLVAYATAHDNVILTPHIGGATRESMGVTENFIAAKVVEILRT